MLLHKPVANQEAAGARVPVAGGFALEENGEVGFRLGRYDPDRA